MVLQRRTVVAAVAAIACALALSSVASAGYPSLCDDAGAGWTTVFHDDFDGPSLNMSNWNYTLGVNGGSLRDAWGTKDNVYLEGGALVLRSQRQNVTVPAGHFNATSGAVNSQGLQHWAHGRVCVKAALPGTKAGQGDGVWPAIWMMPDDSSCWPDHGEIDVMEMINADGVSHGTYHWDRGYPAAPCTGQKGNTAVSGNVTMPADWATAYHEYAVEWNGHDHLTFFVDAAPIVTVTPTNTSHAAHPQFSGAKFYLILNTAIGGPWPRPPNPQTVFPTYHRIDSVKVLQQGTTVT